MTPEMIRTPRGLLVGRVPVTQGLYRSVVGTNPSHFSSCGDDCPVEKVSWYAAVKFANALSRQEGLEECYSISGESVSWPKGLSCTGYRLPTEAEWEYAARAGEDTLYAGGDNLDAVGWHSGDSGGKTHAVGGKQANAWGLYDMSGNVWEWVWDLYEAHSSYRVYRGGSWGLSPRYARLAFRNRHSPDFTSCDIGFRLVRSV